MNRSLLRSTIWTIALCGISASVQAQSRTMEFFFDEDGVGLIRTDDNMTFRPNPGHMLQDTTGGVNGLVLTYDLPAPVVLGDVGFHEIGLSDLSDVFRFWVDPVVNSYHLNFYSGLEDGQEALADVGLPQNFSGNIISETLDQFGNQICELGFAQQFPLDNHYVALSDAVPEPASMIPLGMGLAAIVGLRLRKS